MHVSGQVYFTTHLNLKVDLFACAFFFIFSIIYIHLDAVRPLDERRPEYRGQALDVLVLQPFNTLLQSNAQGIDFTSQRGRLRAYGRCLSTCARRHLCAHL